MKIIIAEDYTKTPGGRFINEGDFSGEDFRIKFLSPLYAESLKNKEKLIVNMDGCYGFAPSFLDEAFGGLARERKEDILLNIQIISEDEPGLYDRIKKFVKKALK